MMYHLHAALMPALVMMDADALLAVLQLSIVLVAICTILPLHFNFVRICSTQFVSISNRPAEVADAMQTRQSDLAQESMLHWPAVSARMAPQLFSLYTDAMSTKEERIAARHAQAPAERRATPATVRAGATAGQDAEAISRVDAIEEATAAGVRADEIAAAEAAEPETALEMMPATDIAEPPAGPMDVDTAGPDAMYQHDDFAAGTDM